MPRILVLDEQTIYRAGLRSLISAEIPRRGFWSEVQRVYEN
jgi:hypothetical protein